MPAGQQQTPIQPNPNKPKNWEPAYYQIADVELQQISRSLFSRYQARITAQAASNPTQAAIDQAAADKAAADSLTSGGSTLSITVVTNLLQTIKDMIMALSASVQTLVDQVTASKSIEASSAAALTQLAAQSKANADQIATLVASAGTAGMSAEDTAAVVQAAKDLADSAAALQTAVPANVPPVAAPVDPIPPAVTP